MVKGNIKCRNLEFGLGLVPVYFFIGARKIANLFYSSVMKLACKSTKVNVKKIGFYISRLKMKRRKSSNNRESKCTIGDTCLYTAIIW